MARNTNYIAYRLSNGSERVGSLDFDSELIQPLSHASGTPLKSLYEVIEIQSPHGLIGDGEPVALSSVRILPPVSGRDILAVGKDYLDHAAKLNKPTYDECDTAASNKPSLPVVFTKRATSIIAHHELILPHAGFTDTLDYQGEIGVIVGKPGFRIRREDASQHVWGYTIVNDVTARERQKDHKQFYTGKSADTFFPMGPIAVPKESVPTTLNLQTLIQSRKGSKKRQECSTKDLRFSVPVLIETISQGLTLQAGDVLATGTPAGVGFGSEPRSFLRPGDEISISVTGLGTLSNTVASYSAPNLKADEIADKAHISYSNASKSLDATSDSIVHLNSKPLHYLHCGSRAGPPIIFVHGLAGMSENFRPLIKRLELEKTHSLHLVDLEGHGMSPTLATSVLSISSFARDIAALIDHLGFGESHDITVIAHSMGCYAAMCTALLRPRAIRKLVLVGPPPNPLPDSIAKVLTAEAAAVRKAGMMAVLDAVETNSLGTSAANPLAVAAVRLSHLHQDPEGYAKGCAAMAESANHRIDVGKIEAETFLITGDADWTSPPSACETYNKTLPLSRGVHILRGVGHWHMYEDLEALCRCVAQALAA